MYQIVSYLCGLIFGLGLCVSNMTNPNKILNFLDITGLWDPSLLIVMASALSVSMIGFYLIKYFRKPVLTKEFLISSQTVIDKKLVIGSILFGIGWGIGGYCPGPGLTALSTLSLDPLYFIGSMFVTSWLYYWIVLKPR
jgi:uncharacterized membrane protein YedE/YeeE